MVFKRMLSAFGAGGPSVDTVLSNPNTRPGLALDGVVHLQGGELDADIEQLAVALVTELESEGDDIEHRRVVEFQRLPVSGAFTLAAGQQLSIPFQLPVPWEAPITDVYGHGLHGMKMGLRTEVKVARAVDKGDLDRVFVHPLPVQEQILDAFTRLGFRFKHADLEHGRIYGVQQALPFFQEIEYFAAPQYAHAVNEVELTFVASPHSMDVVLEADKRGGIFSAGHDTYGRHEVEYGGSEHVDWSRRIDEWMRQLIAGYGSHGHHGPHGYPGHDGWHGHHEGYGHHEDYGHHEHGSGLGGVVAGAALGFAGGMIAGEIVEEAFDGDDFGFGDD